MIGEPMRLPSPPAISAMLFPSAAFFNTSPSGRKTLLRPIKLTLSITAMTIAPDPLLPLEINSAIVS
jgi:hypothetical protein